MHDGQLYVQGMPALGIDEIESFEPVQRGAYAGLAARRYDGSLLALAPVFLSRAKAERVGERVQAVVTECRMREVR